MAEPPPVTFEDRMISQYNAVLRRTASTLRRLANEVEKEGMPRTLNGPGTPVVEFAYVKAARAVQTAVLKELVHLDLDLLIDRGIDVEIARRMEAENG